MFPPLETLKLKRYMSLRLPCNQQKIPRRKSSREKFTSWLTSSICQGEKSDLPWLKALPRMSEITTHGNHGPSTSICLQVPHLWQGGTESTENSGTGSVPLSHRLIFWVISTSWLHSLLNKQIQTRGCTKTGWVWGIPFAWVPTTSPISSRRTNIQQWWFWGWLTDKLSCYELLNRVSSKYR